MQSTDMSQDCLFNLVVTPQVEAAVTDWLLACSQVSGFSSSPIFGHGSSSHSMSLAEQVAGKRKQVLFQFHLPSVEARQLLEGIKHEFGGSGMHYWLVPLIDAGHVD